jgi:hypothetical protein
LIHCRAIVLTNVDPAPVMVPDAQFTLALLVLPGVVVELLEVELELPQAAAVSATATAATPRAERRPIRVRARRSD